MAGALDINTSHDLHYSLYEKQELFQESCTLTIISLWLIHNLNTSSTFIAFLFYETYSLRKKFDSGINQGRIEVKIHWNVSWRLHKIICPQPHIRSHWLSEFRIEWVVIITHKNEWWIVRGVRGFLSELCSWLGDSANWWWLN